MRIDYQDYIKLVTGTYNNMRSNNQLSTLLAKPTRSSIRKECLHVLNMRYRNEDASILKGFFGPADSKAAFLSLIENSGAEQFRTLNNFLKGETENTDHVNVELLAWLIDFRHRPWFLGMEVNLNEEEKIILANSETELENKPVNVNEEFESIDLEEKEHVEVAEMGIQESKKTIHGTDEPGPDKSTTKPETIQESIPYGKSFQDSPIVPDSKKGNWFVKRKKIMIAAVLLLLITSGIYIWQVIDDQQGCMYWNGDQYVPVDCNERPPGRTALPLQVEQMKNFQRITRKDTITEWSIGKLYYIKHKNKIEYYTYSGNYPEDLNRYVKRLSRYIFDKDKENRK